MATETEKEEAVVHVAAIEGRWQEAEARVVVEAWERSGEPLAVFVRRYGMCRRRVGHWVKRLKGRTPEEIRFHPVRVVEGKGHDGRNGEEPIEILLDEMRSVRVPPGFAAEDLERVLRVLGVGTRC